MKLSECWIGRVVQYKEYTYDQLLSNFMFGHVRGFFYIEGQFKVQFKNPHGNLYALRPNELKPLED